jgi:hypothetical protein
MPSLFYAGQPDYIEKLNTLATAASMTNGTVAASFLSLAVTGTATAASFVGPLTGNASTATTLATARNINGVSFNGSADITVTAAAGTLSGATLAAGVTASSLTSVGTLTALTVSGQASFAAGTAAAPSVKVGAEQNGLYSSAANTLDVTLNGVRQAQFAYTAAAVNYLTITGSNGGNPTIGASAGNVAFSTGVRISNVDAGSPIFGVSGTTRGVRFNTSSFGSSIEGVDNTLGASYQPLNIVASVLGLYTTGVNAIALGTSGSTPQMYVTNTASAVNFAQITGGVTGNAVRYGVGGSDSNVTWAASSKGTFGLGFYTNDFSQLQFAVNHTASAVNYAQITGSATGNAVAYGVAGTDTNIGLKYATKGTGAHSFLTNGSTEQFRIVHVANAANYWSVFGKVTGGSPTFYADGSDSLVNASYSLKGGGAHVFYTGTTSAVQLVVDHVASTVNRPVISGSATGNAVTISAQGSDSNIDFAITTKGTGNVRFGTHSAIAAETVTGYITVKDSAGNTRKLAVLS